MFAAPILWRIGGGVLVLVALWLGYERWSAHLIETGVMQERKAWEAKNLEQTVKNQTTRAERAEAALDESHQNAVTSDRLDEFFRKVTEAQAARITVLKHQATILNDALFTAAPAGGDKCRVYVTPAFISAANAGGE
jgi:hypothetical protein